MKIKDRLLSIKRENIVRLVGCVVFLAIAFKLFSSITYLFRYVDYDRNHIVGIENESNLDMVYIGGSAAFVYWQPLRAWRDCGFTSFNCATNTIQAEQIKAYMEEVQKSQNPELFVVGVRAFEYYSDEPAEGGLRRGTDGMDITSMARYHLLRDYFHNRTVPEDTDILSYYLDIAKYHVNTVNLTSPRAWGFINNNGISPDKGWEWIDSYAYLEEPAGFYTEERAELPENASETLKDLLDYCREEDLNVLFVVCPYYLTAESYARYNTIGDIVTDYGFSFLNANEYYDEMELDFAADFYNKNHVNLFGASKYTEFLEHYIEENYNMPDHRGDTSYEAWNADSRRFFEEEQKHAETVAGIRRDVEYGAELAEEMLRAADLSQWDILAEDDRYTLLLVTMGDYVRPSSPADKKILSKWQLTEDSAGSIRVIDNSKVTYTNEEDGALEYSGEFEPWKDIPYKISVEDGQCSMSVNDEEIPMAQTGINLVVWDKNYRKVVDKIWLSDENGENMVIRR